jgi:WD40 repeat protein
MIRLKKAVPALSALLLLILLGQISHLVLEDLPKTLPDAAWPPLPLRAEVRMQGQFDCLAAAAFSPQGKYLAVGGCDPDSSRWLRFWEVANRRELGVVPWRAVSIWRLAFSPNGNTLASTAEEAVQLWDLVGQTSPTTAQRFVHPATALAFAPEGATLALGKGDGSIMLCQPASGLEKALRRGHISCVLALGFSPDGRVLASAGYDQSVRLWDVASGKELAALWGHEAPVQVVAFSPDGQVLASGSEDRTVRLWDVRSGILRTTLRGHRDVVSSLAFSQDGRFLATASVDTTALLWDVGTGKPRGSARGHQGKIWSMAFAPDGKTLLTCDTAGIVRHWDVTRVCPVLTKE